MATALDDLRSTYERLSQRDRNLLLLMAGAISLFIVFMVGLSLSRAAAKREQRIQDKTKSLREVAQLTQGYRQAESQHQEMERKLRDHAVRNLMGYLDGLGKQDGLDISGMTDKGSSPLADAKDSKIVQSSVEVTLTRVPLDKLTKFLNDVETTPGVVKVTRLQVRPREDDAVLDAWFTVSTYYLGS